MRNLALRFYAGIILIMVLLIPITSCSEREKVEPNTPFTVGPKLLSVIQAVGDLVKVPTVKDLDYRYKVQELNQDYPVSDINEIHKSAAQPLWNLLIFLWATGGILALALAITLGLIEYYESVQRGKTPRPFIISTKQNPV